MESNNILVMVSLIGVFIYGWSLARNIFGVILLKFIMWLKKSSTYNFSDGLFLMNHMTCLYNIHSLIAKAFVVELTYFYAQNAWVFRRGGV